MRGDRQVLLVHRYFSETRGNWAVYKNGIKTVIDINRKRKKQMYMVTGFDYDDTKKEATDAVLAVIAQHGYKPEFHEIYAQVGAVVDPPQSRINQEFNSVNIKNSKFILKKEKFKAGQESPEVQEKKSKQETAVLADHDPAFDYSQLMGINKSPEEVNMSDNTEVRQFIAKAAIYRKFDLNKSQQASFDEDIKKIAIINEISSQTVKLSESDENSFFVLEIQLKHKDYDKKILNA